MQLTRRELLRSMGMAALSSTLFKPRFLLAQSPTSGSGKNVVVINLLGGLDGLAAFPYYSGSLSTIINAELRPDLRISPDKVIAHAGQNGSAQKIGLHPSFAPISSIAGDHIKIIQNYGIPGDPGRSHDTCQTLMSLGASTLRGGENVGFLARLMDHQNWDSFQYWAFSSENPSDTNTRGKPPIVVNNIESLQFPKLWWESGGDESLARELHDSLLAVQIPRDPLATQQRDTLTSMRDTLITVRRDIITQLVGNNRAGNYTDDGLGGTLRDAARILKAKKSSNDPQAALRDTLLLLGQGGYDTHSDQVSSDSREGLAGNLRQLSTNLAVFWADLEAMGALNDTVIVLYSEFGRTVYQNGTRGTSTVGTDHGHGSATMILGGSIISGVVGTPPTVSELRDEDYNALIPSTDYRDIFSDVLMWLGVSPESIFVEEGYQRSPLLLFT